MDRLLIMDSIQGFAEDVAEMLKDEFDIRICLKPSDAIEDIYHFKPDIVLYDPLFTGIAIEPVMRMMTSAGIRVKAVVMSYIPDEYYYSKLWNRDIGDYLLRPCTVAFAAQCIRDLIFSMKQTDSFEWCLENEVDRLLLSLGFNMGSTRYKCVFEAIRKKYYYEDCSMKVLYIDVAKICGGKSQRIEKAIRDAVEDAYDLCKKRNWDFYFMPSPKRSKPYPSNEEFVARMAGALRQKARSHKLEPSNRSGAAEL